MPVTVSQLAVAPVKGMRLQCVNELRLEQHKVAGDREFLVIGEDGQLLLTARTPALLQIEPSWDPAHNVLALRFPDGNVLQDTPEPGARVVTRMYDGREIPGWMIGGPLSDALSGYLGRAVRLFKRDPEHLGNDDEPVTLMSEASLQALAPELSGPAPDQRRFRMTITITGADAWAEHAWGGQNVAIGEAMLRVIAPVPRCAVTTRNPESGATDARVLHALARLRGHKDITFGVWCEIIRPDRIHVGDLVIPPR
ncbi:MAG TPA: MOSC N-terminal beta barrel domain-containing protein [Streptosporangiaceae bacterium]|nr:MOSC N-terminal beta barrel domain-containing protein [Streptosporangiaceae bacterium]